MGLMYLIPQEGRGRLWIMPCPGAATLSESIAAYKAAGADRIVSMLGAPEAAEIGVSDEAALCQKAGLWFTQFEVMDFGLPEHGSFRTLVRQIAGWVAEGDGVAVHCRAGIGRSGMVTACVLVEQGLTADEAVAVVSRARGQTIPDTVEQRQFIADFAAI